ncbi:MAG: UbiA family prenyltransferase [Kiritimatiellaceae bacterium]|nr:UbiA family prenyltransferase [Kiritimatiellaceae bacterium]
MPQTLSTQKPLCVDLDGTLVKTDTFLQALLLLVRTRPATLLSFPRWASGGLAAFKRRIAQEVQLDPAVLPYHAEFLEFLKGERKQGRALWLVTASDELPARAIAAHLGLFTDVLASDGVTNLKAERKRAALVDRFGEKGFDYAGNSRDDLAVWPSAAGVIAVNPSPAVYRSLDLKSVEVYENRPPRWKIWAKALRVHQWTKNVLIFLPMLLAHELTTPSIYYGAFLAFFAFSFAASAIYIFNDLLDLHADQNHPRKKNRPFAAGNLDVSVVVFAIPALVVASLGISFFLPYSFTAILFLYLLITTLYSWRLKQLALLDVLTLAGLYATRIIAGTAAYGVETSSWLIAFSISIFFSLALVKRYSELREALRAHPEAIGARGRGYHARHLPWLEGVGIASGVFSVVVLMCYINSTKVLQFYSKPAMLWLLCPLLLYWIVRVWILAVRDKLSDDPLDFAARDPQTWLIGAISAVVIIVGAI